MLLIEISKGVEISTDVFPRIWRPLLHLDLTENTFWKFPETLGSNVICIKLKIEESQDSEIPNLHWKILPP